MSLLEKKSIFSNISTTFNLSKFATQEGAAKTLTTDTKLEGTPGIPKFGLGKFATQEGAAKTLITDTKLDGTPGTPGFDLGKTSTLQPDSLFTIGVAYGDSTAESVQSWFQDLNGENPSELGIGFDLGIGSTLHVDHLDEQYTHMHMWEPQSFYQAPKVGVPSLDLNGLPGPTFNLGLEPPQDPSNPLYDTIHEQSLLALKKENLDLNGGKGIFQTTKNIRDQANRMSLNNVPGGMTPSYFADLNNTTVNIQSPDGAPVPNNLYFHQKNGVGINRPTKGQGEQIKSLDLHKHLLIGKQHSYTYGNSTAIISQNNLARPLDINGSTPLQYVDKMQDNISTYINNLNN